METGEYQTDNARAVVSRGEILLAMRIEMTFCDVFGTSSDCEGSGVALLSISAANDTYLAATDEHISRHRKSPLRCSRFN
jgi:hypothetical protein